MSPAQPLRPIISAIGITKRFTAPEGGEITALKGVGLDVAAGRFTTLLGPSGCGKTTLLRVIAGFDDPDAGQILIDGADVTHAPPFARPVNTVFQHYALFPHLTVAGNIAYGLEVTGVDRREIGLRVEEALSLVRLGGFGGRRVDQISGGQQQRVALARSLVLRPKVLLLDEPLAALDRKLRKEMQVELKRLQHELGIAFLCVTHDQEEALSMSDVVVVMNKGEIEQIGSPREVYDRPMSRFVAGFVGEASMIGCRAGASSATGTELTLAGGGLLTASACDGPAGDLVAIVRPERLSVRKEGAPHRPYAIAGTVTEAVYLGEKTRLEVSVGGADRLLALVDGAVVPPGVGSAVVLEYDPADIRVVAR